jgi:hypothetical protein
VRNPCFDALGFRFEADTEDPRLTRYISDLFREFDCRGSADHRYAFRSVPAPAWQTHSVLTLDGERLFEAPVPERLVSPLVQDVNRQAVESTDRLSLHAGGVECDGVGFVFPAAMEAGKTTLTAGLVRAGFGYLTDEAVAIDPKTLMIQPYPKPFSLDPGSWGLFPELEPHADFDSDDYKADQWQVPPRAVGRIGRSCPVGVIAFPQYVPDARTELIPIKRSEALVELATNVFGFRARAREALDVLAEVVRGAECYRFTVGDLDAAVGLITRVAGAPTGGRAVG